MGYHLTLTGVCLPHKPYIAVQKSFFQRPDRFGAERIYLDIYISLEEKI
jgi:hypothetical protein